MPILWPYSRAGLQPGDQLRLTVTPPPKGQVTSSDAQNGAVGSTIGSFSVFGIERNQPVVWWAIAFVAIVVAVGALRGLLAVIALGLSGLMLFLFVVPALIAGEPGFLVGLFASCGMMFIVLFLTHGISMRTCAALLGTVGGIAITALIAQLEVVSTRLSGVGDDATGTISTLTTAIDYRGLITCAIIISGLGVLNDITVTQASAAWELRAASPHMSRRAMFTSSLRIGRDHIASSIYTIVFAYAGTGLAVLVVVSLYNRPAFELLTHEDIATEIVRTLCSAIGLVLAMPVTTAIAIALLPPERHRETVTASTPLLAVR
ncbi:YibE/F family protein [Diaminobutyricibacter tongyongensis]|uniref:YibE/F family protein n=1 Tax=Leifsonia tongyongensis TaxID=1268043 RepID=A0A6L9XUS1_9MICO|nr:YibE/F family protein [Diaminobutyricibacter tongyongensis]NEN04768.1 YibE/F family protein [Diaminobutyricibacter tongyongensis]